MPQGRDGRHRRAVGAAPSPRACSLPLAPTMVATRALGLMFCSWFDFATRSWFVSAAQAEEIAAAEFTRVEGVGERTAIALARTAALPGAPLRTLSDLQARRAYPSLRAGAAPLASLRPDRRRHTYVRTSRSFAR